MSQNFWILDFDSMENQNDLKDHIIELHQNYGLNLDQDHPSGFENCSTLWFAEHEKINIGFGTYRVLSISNGLLNISFSRPSWTFGGVPRTLIKVLRSDYKNLLENLTRRLTTSKHLISGQPVPQSCYREILKDKNLRYDYYPYLLEIAESGSSVSLKESPWGTSIHVEDTSFMLSLQGLNSSKQLCTLLHNESTINAKMKTLTAKISAPRFEFNIEFYKLK